MNKPKMPEVRVWLAIAFCAAVWIFFAATVVRLFAQTTVAPDQIRAPRFVAMACVAPGTANADCSGLVYIDAVTPAGKEIKLIGVPPATPIDPAAWSIIP